MRKLIIFLCSFICTSYAFAEDECSYSHWGSYQKTQLYRNSDATAYTFKSSHVSVDADGAPGAYHPDDVGLHCIRGVGFKGLDCPANAGYPSKDWWPSVLVPDPRNSNKAYVQSNGDFTGFFVSQTSLKNRSISDPKNPNRYVDATNIPYIVFPGNFFKRTGTGLMGDIGYAINLDTGEKSAFVAADVGPPNAKLGEISIYLGEKLGGPDPNPRTGTGSPKGEILYVVFPYSAKSHPWPLSNLEIEEFAQSLLDKAGGFEAAKECN